MSSAGVLDVSQPFSNGLREQPSHGIRPSLALPERETLHNFRTMPTVTSADPVLETQVFWYRYKTVIFAILVLAVLGVAAWGGYRFNSERRDATAASALAAAKNSSDYQKVIAQYPGTPASASAYLFLAEDQRKQKKYEEANATLKGFLNKYPTHELRGSAQMAMGANLESLGKLDEALAIYQKLVSEQPDDFVAPAALLAQVPILKAKNKPDEARQACETVLTKYRDRLFSGEAQAKLRLLKPPAPAQTAPPQQPLSPEAIVQNLVPSLRVPRNFPTSTPSSATSSPAAASTAAPATTAAAPPAAPAQQKHPRGRRHR